MFKSRNIIIFFTASFLLSFSLPISIVIAEPFDYVEDIIISIDEELVNDYTQDLVDFGPKVTGSDECIEAENYVYEELQKTGLSTEYHPWINGEYEGRNIEAILPGESENSFIVCAHLDTVEESPGADDDCTGVAAVLAAAKSISENIGDMIFANTIRFVVFTGTEQMYKGSFIYTNNLNDQGVKVIGVIEAHMLDYIGDTEDGNTNMNIIKNKYMSEWIADIAESTAQNYDDLIGLTVNRLNAVGSYGDRYPFEVFRDSFTFFSAFIFNADVHSPEDTIDKLDFEYAARLTKLITATMVKISNNDFDNQPPDKPEPPNGISSGKPNVEYNFSAITTDLENNQVYYKWDWGDGIMSDWLGPYFTHISYPQTCENSYIWDETGDFEVRIKAMDIHGFESDWSDPLVVSMPKTKSLIEFYPWLLRLIQRFPIIEFLL